MTRWVSMIAERWFWKECLLSALVLGAAWLAAHLFIILVDRIFHRLARRTESTLDDRILQVIRRPGFFLILLLGVYGALHRYKFRLLGALDGILFVLAVAVVVYTLIKIAGVFAGWYAEKISKEREAEAAARELLPLAEKMTSLLVLAIGLGVALEHFSIDIKSILVTLGVGSLAVGLALQDTLANMFGGFTIMMDRLFRIGDRIALQSGETGDVQAIGLRSTTVLTPEGNLLIIPNALLVKTIVTNHSVPDARARVILDFGVAFGTDTKAAKNLILETACECPEVLKSPEPAILFRSFGESSLTLRLICFAKSFQDVGVVSDRINTGVDAGFREAGIQVPYPGRAVFLTHKDT